MKPVFTDDMVVDAWIRFAHQDYPNCVAVETRDWTAEERAADYANRMTLQMLRQFGADRLLEEYEPMLREVRRG